MDVVLVDRNRRLAQPLRAALLPGDRLLHAAEAQLAAGHWWPPPARTRAILLVADEPDRRALQALHRLWIAEHGPPSYLLTTPGSPGDRLLHGLAGSPAQQLAGAGWRALRSLSLAHLLALERLITPVRPGRSRRGP